MTRRDVPERGAGRDRYSVANAYRLVRVLQGILNALPENRLGRLSDLRDTLEKFHESRSVYPKRKF
jgi:hypothetical protein